MKTPQRADWAWWHIARRDLRSAIASPLLWLVLMAWLFIVHFIFTENLKQFHGTLGSTTPLYCNALWIGAWALSLCFAPALTMNAWATERSQGTWQLLLTIPVRSLDLVLGKALAAFGLQAILIAATAAMPATLAVISEVAPAHLAVCYLGLLLIASLLAALGTWIGLLVEGPVATFLMTFAAIALLCLLGIGGADGPFGAVAAAVGFGPRIIGFFNGRIALADVLWFASAAGILIVLAAGVIEVRRRSGSAPWWRRAGIAGGPTLAIAALAIAAVAAAQRADLGIDLSADHRFSLSPALEHRLAAEPEAIGLIGVWSDADDQILAPIGDASGRMAQATRRGTWTRLDPQRHLPQIKDFESRHGPTGHPALWVTRGARAQRIALDVGSRRTIQREVAGALISLADPSPPTVRFTSGHGELHPGGGGDDGCDRFIAAMAAVGLRAEPMDDAAPAPPPGDVLALLGPTAPIGAAGLARLDAHLRDGGGVLILADDMAPADLGRWIGRHGLLHASAVPEKLARDGDLAALMDPQARLLRAQHLVSLKHYFSGQEQGLPHHNLLLSGEQMISRSNDPITAPIVTGELQILSPFSAPSDILPAKALEGFGIALVEASPLLSTLKGDAWLRARGDPLQAPQGLEQADPRPLAWSLTYGTAADAASAGRGGRMVVWGSRQAGSDTVLAQESFANARFLVGACRWLANRDPPPEIPETEMRAFQIVISDSALAVLSYALWLVAPFLCLGGAILTWLDQRR